MKLPALLKSRRQHRQRRVARLADAARNKLLAAKQRRIVKKRTGQIRAARAAGRVSHGAAAAVEFALAQIHAGVCEHPAGSNRGPEVDRWNIASGCAPGPTAYWCQSFVNACMVAGGAVQLHSAYTPAVVEWARRGLYGLRLVAKTERRPGDLVYFKFPGVSTDFCDHVGIDIALDDDDTGEGNTSPGAGGSQNNGGVTAVHDRGNGAVVVAVVRPTYPEGAHA